MLNHDIRSVVSTLRGAGIRIFMVTGDFALTAQAIAAECGIITNPPNMVKGISALSRDDAFSTSESIHEDNGEKAVTFSPNTCRSIVLSGPELITLNENQWEQLCKYDEIVFARTTPEQKATCPDAHPRGMFADSLPASYRSRVPR
jgi:sodium/potassium-transporting ATPase subunit alpha